MVSLYISQVGSLTTRIFYCLHSPFQEEKRKIQALDFKTRLCDNGLNFPTSHLVVNRLHY